LRREAASLPWRSADGSPRPWLPIAKPIGVGFVRLWLAIGVGIVSSGD
jgi:hypothetical protein